MAPAVDVVDAGVTVATGVVVVVVVAGAMVVEDEMEVEPSFEINWLGLTESLLPPLGLL